MPSGTFTWTDGDSIDKTFDVPIIDNDTVSGNKTVSIALSNPVGGVQLSSPETAILTIVNDDWIKPPFAEDFASGLPGEEKGLL